jgi:hypothetical protein
MLPSTSVVSQPRKAPRATTDLVTKCFYYLVAVSKHVGCFCNVICSCFFLFSRVRLIREPSVTIISLIFLMSRNEVSDHLAPLPSLSLHQHDPCLLSVEGILFLSNYSAISVNMRQCVNMMSTAWAVFTTLHAVVGLCCTSILSQEVLTSCVEDMWRAEVLHLCFYYRNSIF